MGLVVNNTINKLPVIIGENYCDNINNDVKFINIDEDNNICDILYGGQILYKNCKIKYCDFKTISFLDIELASGDMLGFRNDNDIIINI